VFFFEVFRWFAVFYWRGLVKTLSELAVDFCTKKDWEAVATGREVTTVVVPTFLQVTPSPRRKYAS
jgi:hypothetical protein